MPDFFVRILNRFGLASPKQTGAAAAREAELRARLRDAQAALAVTAETAANRVGADSSARSIIQALKVVERDLRQGLDDALRDLEGLQCRLDMVEHAVSGGGLVDAQRIRHALELDDAEIQQRVVTTTKSLRERLVECVTRGADPRALSGSEPRSKGARLAVPQVTSELIDAWKPTPRAVVSMVLATYNRLELLKLAIQRIRDQKLSVPSEIIVVDGGSTDGTREWLIEQTDIVTIVQHNRVPEEGNRRRRSWGYFINLAFKVAQGKWVCMISDDSLLVPGAVEKGLEHLEALEAKGRNIGGGAFYFRDYPKVDRYMVQHTLGGMLMVNHGFFLKEALIEVGYAEEDLYSFYKADSDLSLKLWDAGYEIVDCPASFIEHLLLPDEELRLHNNQSLDRDRCLIQARWSGRYISEIVPEMFRGPCQVFSDFRDESGTAKLFSPFLGDAPERS